MMFGFIRQESGKSCLRDIAHVGQMVTRFPSPSLGFGV